MTDPRFPTGFVWGAAYDDRVDGDGAVHDPQRVAFLERHLGALARAVASGVPVRGYFAWSLLDNCEWASPRPAAVGRNRR